MKQYIVDAFTDRPFHGNPAAVCLVDAWPPDEMMRQIAQENRVSETAFVRRAGDGYALRWFAPGGEVRLCGHATLATAYVLFQSAAAGQRRLVFHTLSGALPIEWDGEWIAMDFPAIPYRETEVAPLMAEAFGSAPSRAYLGDRLLLIFDDAQTIRDMRPDFDKVALLHAHGVAVTAPDARYDCVSRYFAPRLMVNEDPVTGSAHCMIAPYWVSCLGKSEIFAHQASERGGELHCEVREGRVIIRGRAALYSVGELNASLLGL